MSYAFAVAMDNYATPAISFATPSLSHNCPSRQTFASPLPSFRVRNMTKSLTCLPPHYSQRSNIKSDKSRLLILLLAITPLLFSHLQLAKSMNVHIRSTSPPVRAGPSGPSVNMPLVDPAWPPELQDLVGQIAQMLDGQAQRDTDAVALGIARTRMQGRRVAAVDGLGEGGGADGVPDAKTPAWRQ